MSPPGCRAMSKHEEPHDPLDTLSEGRWAQVPELIRRDVEQHVLAHLPADLLAKWRDQHARGVCIGSDDFLLPLWRRAWLSGTFAENGSATKNWRLAAVSAAIGTIAISGYSPRSLRCASNRWPSSCYVAALKRSDRLARSISIVEILLDLANEIVLPWSRFTAS